VVETERAVAMVIGVKRLKGPRDILGRPLPPRPGMVLAKLADKLTDVALFHFQHADPVDRAVLHDKLKEVLAQDRKNQLAKVSRKLRKRNQLAKSTGGRLNKWNGPSWPNIDGYKPKGS
jgi:hypothetical protein